VAIYGQTPLCEQVGQLVVQHHQRTCWTLARPAPNMWYNLLGAGRARALHHDIASGQQVGQQVGNLLANLFVQWSLAIRQHHFFVYRLQQKQNMTALLNYCNLTFDYYTNRVLVLMLPLGSGNFSPVALNAKT
jgi:hypothetical protein